MNATSPSPVPAPTGRRRDLRFALAALALVVAHCAAAAYFDPPSVIFGKRPISGSDFDTHIEQTWRVLEGLETAGKTWVYDTHLLAGHPNGVIFDADNKGWEYLTYFFVKLGVRRAVAFNLFVLLAHLLVLPVTFISARAFGLTRWARLTATALASWLWLFDSYVHWIWWVGTLAFAFASYFALLPFALFHRYLADRRLVHALGCGVTLALAHLIHPYTFLIVVIPMGALYLRARRTLSLRDHAGVGFVVLFTLAANAGWLAASLAQWHYILDSGYFGQSRLMQLPADYFGVLLDTTITGIIATRTSVRFLCFGAALVVLVDYARRRDPRLLAFVAALAPLLTMTIFGGYSKICAQVQPYRFIGPAMFFATIPAGELVTLLAREGAWKTLSAPLRGALCVLAALGVQKLSGDALSYFPNLLPQVPPLLDGIPSPIDATGHPPFGTYWHIPDHPLFWELPRWVTAHDDGQGRFLVQTSAVGEQLAWKTDAEILGGFVLRNLEHSHSNLFRRRLEREQTPAEVRAYLEAYAVEWVVLTFPDPWFATMPELFERYAEVAGGVVLKTKVPISRFEHGHGEINARTNRILVTHTDPNEDIVLRYHFHEALTCGPRCGIQPSKNPVGGVPFIRIPAPHPANFVVQNTYGKPPAR